jgi:DNA-binding transcriptional MerR regulator
MLKIGDFSRLSQVSVKTLRYYDEVALLKPTQVDEVSGYRYYSVAQLRQLHRILALRDLGFSLDQIGHVLKAELSIEELRGMLRLRRAEQQQRLLKEQERLDRTLSQSYQTVLKWIEANGYQVHGPIREIYLQCGEPLRQDDDSYVTEIQVPTAKI